MLENSLILCGITVQTNQSSYVAAGSDAIGCIGVDGIPTEAGVFSDSINFTVRIKIFLLGCGVNFLSLTQDTPFNFGLEMVILPDASFAGLAGPYCSTDGAVALTPTGTIGGIFSGPGVLGSTFDPALAGPGIHNITYTVSAQEGAAI